MFNIVSILKALRQYLRRGKLTRIQLRLLHCIGFTGIRHNYADHYKAHCTDHTQNTYEIWLKKRF